MSKHDPSLLFDRDVPDHETEICVGVTRCDEGDKELQINIRPIGKYSPRLCFFLTLESAEALAHTLLEAVNAEVYINPHKAMKYGTGD